MANQQVAIITGASRGLGRALAHGLARDGWAVILDARGTEALATVQAEIIWDVPQAKIVCIPGDINDPAHRTALAQAAQTLGGIDLLVNNAGILGPSPQPALIDYPLDVLATVFQANTIAPLAVIQALRAHLQPGARIINVTSDAGVEAYAGWGGYGASKAALEHLSHILAVELPEFRVYWVDPGDMRTEMHQAAFPGEDISDRPPPEESVPGFLTLIHSDLPSGRYVARALISEPNDA